MVAGVRLCAGGASGVLAGSTVSGDDMMPERSVPRAVSVFVPCPEIVALSDSVKGVGGVTPGGAGRVELLGATALGCVPEAPLATAAFGGAGVRTGGGGGVRTGAGGGLAAGACERPGVMGPGAGVAERCASALA